MLNKPLYTGKHQFCFNLTVSGQKSLQRNIEHCTVLLQSTIECHMRLSLSIIY